VAQNVDSFFRGNKKVFVGDIAYRTDGLAKASPGAQYQVMGGELFESDGSSWFPAGSTGAARVYALGRKAIALGASATYDSTDVLGFMILDPGTGADWSWEFKDGGTIAIPFAALSAGQIYPFHLASITSPAGGSACLLIP